MFENILHQKEAVDSLVRGIKQNDLPRALLFSGPLYAGKFTAAIELARSLSCRLSKAEWNCSCPACETHRHLSAPDLALLGNRNFSEEISAALSLLSREDAKDRERMFFLRSVRKLTRRFDESLWQGEETRLSKAAPLLLSIDELMDEFGNRAGNDPDLKSADKIASECRKLGDFVPDAIPIFQVRSIAFWCRLKPRERIKTIIVENAETMQESSRNAFLKMLEEPPPNVEFVLATTKRGAIMRTLLSRLRTIQFCERKPEQMNEVIDRIFRTGPQKDGLKGFFSSFMAIPGDASMELALSFLADIVSDAAKTRKIHPEFAKVFPEEKRKTVSEILKATKNFGAREGPEYRGAFTLFLESAASGTAVLLHADPDTRIVGTAEKWSSLLAEARQRYAVFNIQPQAIMEFLRSSMKDAL